MTPLEGINLIHNHLLCMGKERILTNTEMSLILIAKTVINDNTVPVLEQYRSIVRQIKECWELKTSWDNKHSLINDIWMSRPTTMDNVSWYSDTTYQEDVTCLYEAVIEKYGDLLE